MSHNTTIVALYATLHGCLPYEYDVQCVEGKDANHIITINKKDSERTMYVSMNTPSDDGILDAVLYDDADDEPTEICQWDTNDPDYNLIDLIAYIEKTL